MRECLSFSLNTCNVSSTGRRMLNPSCTFHCIYPRMNPTVSGVHADARGPVLITSSKATLDQVRPVLVGMPSSTQTHPAQMPVLTKNTVMLGWEDCPFQDGPRFLPVTKGQVWKVHIVLHTHPRLPLRSVGSSFFCGAAATTFDTVTAFNPILFSDSPASSSAGHQFCKDLWVGWVQCSAPPSIPTRMSSRKKGMLPPGDTRASDI